MKSFGDKDGTYVNCSFFFLSILGRLRGGLGGISIRVKEKREKPWLPQWVSFSIIHPSLFILSDTYNAPFTSNLELAARDELGRRAGRWAEIVIQGIGTNIIGQVSLMSKSNIQSRSSFQYFHGFFRAHVNRVDRGNAGMFNPLKRSRPRGSFSLDNNVSNLRELWPWRAGLHDCFSHAEAVAG